MRIVLRRVDAGPDMCEAVDLGPAPTILFEAIMTAPLVSLQHPSRQELRRSHAKRRAGAIADFW